MISKPYQLALFGDPVKHSLSPVIHQCFAQQHGLSIDYQLIKVTGDGFVNAVETFFAEGGHGANVTLPHKNLALQWLQSCSDKAQQAQAVNTLYKNGSGEIIGDNTDGIGFIKDLKNRCGFDCQDKKILILGAGGAAQGVAAAIMTQHPQHLLIANRSLHNAEKIAAYENSSAMTLKALQNTHVKFDLIVHASSLGHSGKTLEFYPHQVGVDTLCYDLSYGHAAQAFIDHAQMNMVNHCFDGLGMLIEQAAFAFELWFDVRVDTKPIVSKLKFA